MVEITICDHQICAWSLISVSDVPKLYWS